MKAVRKTITLPYYLPIPQLAAWCTGFTHFLLLDSNAGKTGQQDQYAAYDYLVGAGSIRSLAAANNSFNALREFHDDGKDWVFGHLSYDLKEERSGLHSPYQDRIQFPKMSFFIPRYVITGKNGTTSIHFLEDIDNNDSIGSIIDDIKAVSVSDNLSQPTVALQPTVTKDHYIEQAKSFLRHIHRGDIYEANYCIEFYSTHVPISPLSTFLRLNTISPMPGSAFYRLDNKYLMCASPERFLARRGEKLISQPIKGTIRRGTTAAEDDELVRQLLNDPKERAENVMITDLVRNDLSIVAERGSVQVEALMALKTYPRIHQLVTTVTAQLAADKHWTDALKEAFPMGSMTGAPKRRAMEIIDQLESSRRGLYSGSVGYVQPDGDFDFNVVIRSIQYDHTTAQLSAMAGSALTAGCDPEKEYEECLLKMTTMKNALS